MNNVKNRLGTGKIYLPKPEAPGKEKKAHMGLYRRGKMYWFNVMFQGKRIQESLGTSNKRLAEKLFAKVMTDLVEGRYFEKPKDITLNTLLEKYMEEASPRLSATSHERNKQIMAQLRPTLGVYDIKSVTPSVLSKYKTERLKKVTPSTLRKELAVLSRVFNLAIDEWELCQENPVRKILKSLKVDDARTRYISPEEAQKLRFTVSGWLRPIVIVAVQTGLRRGNLLNLTLRQVDFERNLIIVEMTKNGQAVNIPMTKLVRDTIRSVVAERKVASPYVFCDETGKPYSGGKVSVAFRRACEKAGIKNLRFHDLRHDFATTLVRSGVDLYRVQKLCGHKDQRMTQRYAHLNPESLREAVGTIEETGTATILLQLEQKKGVTSP